ncbi:efflux transporter outer membrane subunit [Lonepinella sp. MS14436]|uniref:efflux transporter outer membrane subunit n=1 Tax=Lonepinella sp. MS14436 TaxID=3003619 RepID=UPI0036D78770
MQILHRTFKLSMIAGFVAILTACNATVDAEQASSVNTPVQFDQVKAGQSQMEIKQWWQNWNDPELSRLIEKGLSQNLDIALAQARLNEARANYDYAEADKGINVSGNASTGGGISRMKMGNSSADTSGSGNIYGGVSASWELDFFGKKKSDADAAHSLTLAQQEQLYAAQMLVASEIANNYFQIYALDRQANLINQAIKELQSLENYVKGRFNTGGATAYEVTEISTQITAQQARLATLKAQADQAQRNIAVLTGDTPQGFRIVKSGNPLARIPAVPNGVLPSDVISNRPDLRTAQHNVDVYAAKLASAKADLYPRFNISFMGDGGYVKLDNDLSNISGILGMVSAGVQLPIFTNGRLEANIDAADARLKSAVIQYDQTLLTALKEVDNAYQMSGALKKQTTLNQKAVNLAKKQAQDAQTLFQHGNKTLDVAIRARVTALNNQEAVVQSQLSQAQNWVGLYKALGGGWR